MSLVLLLVVAAVVAFVWWRLSLRFKPYKSVCWFCRGKGKFPGSKMKKHGPCPFCGGKPKLRVGAKERR